MVASSGLFNGPWKGVMQTHQRVLNRGGSGANHPREDYLNRECCVRILLAGGFEQANAVVVIYVVKAEVPYM